jgi:hypothetical protein
MTDEFEIGGDEDGDDEGERGRQGSVDARGLQSVGGGVGGSSSSSSYFNTGATATRAGTRGRSKVDYSGKDD